MDFLYSMAMQRRILIADPRADRLRASCSLLESSGFQVIGVQDVTADATSHAHWPPDAVVVAPGLKQTTGFLKKLVDHTPFVTQPDALQSLPALVSQHIVEPSRALTFGRATADLERLAVFAPAGEVKLTAIEADLLAYLSMHPARAIHRSQLLQRVWGYNSNVASRAVDSTVKRLRKKIEEDPSKPSHIITVFGVGYRLVEYTGERSAAAPAPVALPSSTSTFLVGREEEFAGITQAFARGKKVVTIRGFGGVGKTALARHWVEQNATGGVWFVDLNHARSSGDILHALAHALKLSGSLSEEDAPEAIQAALRALNGGVIVLDNCEQVRGETCEVLRVLQQSDGFTWLVTSREALGLSTEHVLSLGSLAPEMAVQLFHDRVEALGFLPIPESDHVHVGEIAAALDHLPLAIERAAAQMSVLSVPELLLRLQRNQPEWVDPERPERQQTLRATLQWSWDLLAEDEQQALAQCGVFEGGFNLSMAEDVLRVPGARPVSQVLASLMKRSLLYSPSSGRLAMLNLTTDFARWKLNQLGFTAATQQRHAEAMIRYGTALRSAHLFATWQPCTSLVKEHQNFLAAFHCVEDCAQRFELYRLLDWIYFRIGPKSQRRPLLDSLGPFSQFEPEHRAHLWIRKAAFSRETSQGAYDECLELAYGEALQTGSPATIRAVLLECLESNRSFRRDPTHWLRRFQELSEDTVEDRGVCFFYEGVAAHDSGEREEAIRLYHLAATTIHGETNPHYAAMSAYRHGFLLFESGQIESAERAFFRCLSIIEARDADTANGLQALLALTSLARGEHALALQTLEHSLQWGKQYGNLRHMYEDLFLKGICLQLQGSCEAARTAYQASLQGRQHLSQGFDVQVTMAFLATAESALGATLDARRWIARATEREGCPAEESQIIACCAQMIRYLGSSAPTAKAEAESWLAGQVDVLPYTRLGWAVQLFRGVIAK